MQIDLLSRQYYFPQYRTVSFGSRTEDLYFKAREVGPGRTYLENIQFRKVISGVDEVFHQTLNLAILWETSSDYFPSFNQKSVLAISREIYIPANWHQPRNTEMLKHRVIFISIGVMNFTNFS